MPVNTEPAHPAAPAAPAAETPAASARDHVNATLKKDKGPLIGAGVFLAACAAGTIAWCHAGEKAKQEAAKKAAEQKIIAETRSDVDRLTYVDPQKVSPEKKNQLLRELAVASFHKGKMRPLSAVQLHEWLLTKWLPVFGGIEDGTTGNIICGQRTEGLDPHDSLKRITSCDVAKDKEFYVRPGFYELFMQAHSDMEAKYEDRWIRKSWQWKCPKVTEAMRNNHQQYLLWLAALNPNDPDPLKKGFRVMPPCWSFHETGFAVHLANPDQSEKFLRRYGIYGGARGIEDDFHHFSLGEIAKKGWMETRDDWAKRKVQRTRDAIKRLGHKGKRKQK